MDLVEAHFRAGSPHDAADDPCLELDRTEHVAVPPEVIGRVAAGRDLRHRAMDDGTGWANEHQRANRPQTRPEKPAEPGIGVEAAPDHVSRAAGETGGQALGGFPLTAEQRNFVRRRVVAVGAYDGEAVFPATGLANSG